MLWRSSIWSPFLIFIAFFVFVPCFNTVALPSGSSRTSRTIHQHPRGDILYERHKVMPACYQQTPNSGWRFKAAALPSERHFNAFQSSFAAPSKLLTFVTPAITQLPTRLVSRVPTMACTRQREADHRHRCDDAFCPVNASLQIARSRLAAFSLFFLFFRFSFSNVRNDSASSTFLGVLYG